MHFHSEESLGNEKPACRMQVAALGHREDGAGVHASSGLIPGIYQAFTINVNGWHRSPFMVDSREAALGGYYLSDIDVVDLHSSFAWWYLTHMETVQGLHFFYPFLLHPVVGGAVDHGF